MQFLQLNIIILTMKQDFKTAEFKKTREVYIGGNGNTERITIGRDSPVTIQTMWKEGIADVKDNPQKIEKIVQQINSLKLLGCDIIRFAVPDMESAESFIQICRASTMPLVADIHFDYRLALKCLEGPVGAIRINPGNIGARDRVEAVVNACRDTGTAIRIGVNTGSLPHDLAEQVNLGKISRALALSETAARESAVFDELNFNQFVVSMKASSVQETIDANEDFARRFEIPLHVGVTEAGPLITGVVKSTLAFSHLLKEGIGNTIRVSLSSSPENEVITGLEILRECGKRQGGIKLVSCPRCGRLGFDVHGFMQRWQNKLLSMKKDITVAVMGCVVNGPGEGKHADLGIAGAGGKAILFKKGVIVETVDIEKADEVFEKLLNEF